MPYGNTNRTYGSVSKTFHWVTALLVLTLIPLGLLAQQGSEVINAGTEPVSGEYIARVALMFSLHKTLGVTVFFLALARLIWTLSQPRPGLLNADNRPEAFAAEFIHLILYSCLVLTPLTGWIYHAATQGFAPIFWPFGQGLPFVPKSESVAHVAAQLHYLAQWLMIGAITLHVLGAIKHHVIDRDSTLRRMLPGNGADLPTPPNQAHSRLPGAVAVVVWVCVLGFGTLTGLRDGSSPENGEQTAVALEQMQSSWEVQEGTIAIELTQYGKRLKGGFNDWEAAINFADPGSPGPAGDVEVIIAIGSLKLGSVTKNALKKDYFNAKEFPTSRFVADLVKTETGYEAIGTLTLRDKTVDVAFPFTLEEQDGSTAMSATLTLNRLDFAVGENEPTEKTLKFDVDVKIELVAKSTETS